MSWRAWLGTILLVAAIVSGWSAWRQRADPLTATGVADRSDYVLHDFELVSLDAQGKESFTLRAPELARNPADGTIALQTPLFLLPDPDGTYWEVRSRTGWLSASHDELRLRGDVVAKAEEAAADAISMNTEQLNVFPQTNLATSAVPVTITQSGSTMRGSSMQADLAAKNVKLKDVRTRYAPNRR
ncbi:LPS export ABC transporter periplasmic protein LptC [Luteimonas vadosa]|uniref:LPS export ABC transporter periplasmic protein LptC n=1 Tax=Luteimonas vadosa TaxID=1165507 RepID=A0ABP9DV59_9GAMM